MKIISTCEEQTLELGRQIGRSLKGNEVICLVGPLGAGKTTLVKGIAQGMEILEGYQVRSPTFTLVNEYPTKRGKIIHVDFYRVKDLDITEFIGQGVLLIEWPTDLTYCDVIIRIEFLPDGRLIIFENAESLQLTDKTFSW
ncbi:MAG: tRNA (adenosine(37)-N6)-threonylcarbamoyltransferase complex ATPase subunit type 1 TsaE [Hydrogenobacter sp.]